MAGVAVLAVAGVAVTVPGPRGPDGTAPGGGGGTVLTLRATAAGGPDRTATALSYRFAAYGLPETTARVRDGSHIVVSAPAWQPQDVLRKLIAPGDFQIRLVLGWTPADGTEANASANAGDPALPEPTVQEVQAKLGPGPAHMRPTSAGVDTRIAATLLNVGPLPVRLTVAAPN